MRPPPSTGVRRWPPPSCWRTAPGSSRGRPPRFDFQVKQRAQARGRALWRSTPPRGAMPTHCWARRCSPPWHCTTPHPSRARAGAGALSSRERSLLWPLRPALARAAEDGLRRRLMMGMGMGPRRGMARRAEEGRGEEPPLPLPAPGGEARQTATGGGARMSYNNKVKKKANRLPSSAYTSQCAVPMRSANGGREGGRREGGGRS